MATARDTFQLDLSALTVLTEAASGWFALTPIIASLAGAREVIAVGKDSVHGSFEKIEAHITALAGEFGCKSRLRIVSEKSPAHVSCADIVTNLGFVRPIDALMISFLKPTAAVALMWEPWEFREGEVDLAACRQRNIPVLGTDEQVPELRTFDFVGMLALKLLLEADIEVRMCRVAILGGGPFAASAANHLSAAGAAVGWIRPEASMPEESKAVPAANRWANFTQEGTLAFIRDADALLILEHRAREELIGPRGMIDFHDIRRLNEGLTIVHICGGIDLESLNRSGLPYHPAQIQPAGFMSRTTAHLGPRPLIDLHTAGLRVGEVLTRCRISGASAREAVLEAIKSAPGKDFV
jgi:hypothetical protein